MANCYEEEDLVVTDVFQHRDGLMCLRSPQDGSLERLSPAEFVGLCQAVEAFSKDTEELCGRRSMSLRGALQNQANRFVHRFHDERKTKLRFPSTLYTVLIPFRISQVWKN